MTAPHSVIAPVRDDTPPRSTTAAGIEPLRQGPPALGVAVTVADMTRSVDESLGAEPVGAKLRNALMIVNAAGQRLFAAVTMPGVGSLHVGFRQADLADVQRLVAGAIEQCEREALEHRQTRRNLELALARIRRLELGRAAAA